MDTVRLADLLGTGVAGVLWTRDAGGDGTPQHFFLDFTGGVKPYLLNAMDNHMGAVTEVTYAPSTRVLPARTSAASRRAGARTLPFPGAGRRTGRGRATTSRRGTLTTEYRYHHGYWDGVEREFRGFGMVEQLDTEVFALYQAAALLPMRPIAATARARSSAPPVLTATWFHQGPVAAG